MKARAALATCLLLAGCSLGDGSAPTELDVLAGSELADMAPLLSELERDTGVKLRMDYSDDTLEPGRYHHDLAWLPSDRYFRLKMKAGARREPPLSTTTMLSPVVIGVKPEAAAKLRRDPSWADIADAAGQGRLRFAMADPRTNGSGLGALVGVATAARGGALRPEDVTCDRLRGFFTGHTRAARSSPKLIEEYVANQDQTEGLIAHESTLLSLNATGRLRQPLQIVYPRDGMVMSDYPMLLLDPAKRAAYDKVAGWLKSDTAQRKIMQRTLRRPLGPDVARDPRLRASVGNALFFPDQRKVIDTLLAGYDDPAERKPDRVVFLLDFSRSMAGARIDAVKSAFAGLGGADGSSVGRFVRFHKSEEVTVIRFGGRVLGKKTFTAGAPGAMDGLRDFVAGDDFDGSTAIWSALDSAYDLAGDTSRRTSIVLMTDGQNNAGITLDDFLRHRRPRTVPTFAVGFGAADRAGLRRAATATGGRFVDGDTRPSLLEALKEIRGCH
ncbi:VWA domain-containing protein [Actinomadura rudentiformis]|uniref:VWA domain-containing protein n=2 Tax=Actinomadura rudentiformis TaxID=359158 RepID=A0A6H9YMC0_9ACTN|nr:VWA domain-containing protein [Actinomadura rudentiformis]